MFYSGQRLREKLEEHVTKLHHFETRRHKSCKNQFCIVYLDQYNNQFRIVYLDQYGRRYIRKVLLMLRDLPFSVIRAKRAWKGLAFIIILRLWRVCRVVISEYSIFFSWDNLVILETCVQRLYM